MPQTSKQCHELRLVVKIVVFGLITSLLVFGFSLPAQAASNVNKSCLQPPKGLDLTQLTPKQLVLYGLPQYIKGESYKQWTKILRSARHHVCTTTSTKEKHLRVPSKRNDTTSSTNWSGYEANGNGGYNEADFTWTVPCIASGSPSGDSSIWVGLGGDGNQNLVQTGTEQSLSYFLWFPIYTYQAWVENVADPNNPNEQVVFGVNCGDAMVAYVLYPNTMYIQDMTSGTYSQQSYGPNASTNTAEFIVERPELSGSLSPLDDFQTANLTQSEVTTTDGTGLGLDQTTYNEITMISNDGSTPLDSVSSIDSSTESFTVTWQKDQ